MPLVDVYGRTHELDAKSIDTIATRLEARRGSAKYMGMLQEYLEAIDLAATQSILALGCGTGAEVGKFSEGRISEAELRQLISARTWSREARA
jgi:hypothetical protein